MATDFIETIRQTYKKESHNYNPLEWKINSSGGSRLIDGRSAVDGACVYFACEDLQNRNLQ